MFFISRTDFQAITPYSLLESDCKSSKRLLYFSHDIIRGNTAVIKTSRKAKSVRIAELLKQELAKNPPAPGSRTASAAELAEHYDISVPTAHNVLNLLVQEGLLFRKHGSGTFFSKKQPLTIGILDQPVGAILPREIDAVLGRFCEYALQFLKEHDCVSKVISYQELFKPDVFADLNGLLVSQLFVDETTLSLFRQSRLPFVVYRCGTTEKKPYSCCEFDIETGIKEALKFFELENKDSRIFLFSETTPEGIWMKSIYLNEFSACNLSLQEDFVFDPQDTAVESYRTVRVQAEKFRNSVIFCTSDVLAINLYNALLLEKFLPGRDFRLIGVDDTEGYNSNIHDPPVIASIHKPIDTMSFEALKLLLRMIDEPTGNDTVVRIPTTFIPRKSSERIKK